MDYWEDFKKLKSKSPYKSYSIINELKNQGKIDNNFLSKIDQITLEDLIAIKLESATKAAGGKLYGMRIFYNIDRIIKESVLKTAISAGKDLRNAASFLGIPPDRLGELLGKFNLKQGKWLFVHSRTNSRKRHTKADMMEPSMDRRNNTDHLSTFI